MRASHFRLLCHSFCTHVIVILHNTKCGHIMPLRVCIRVRVCVRMCAIYVENSWGRTDIQDASLVHITYYGVKQKQSKQKKYALLLTSICVGTFIGDCVRSLARSSLAYISISYFFPLFMLRNAQRIRSYKYQKWNFHVVCKSWTWWKIIYIYIYMDEILSSFRIAIVCLFECHNFHCCCSSLCWWHFLFWQTKVGTNQTTKKLNETSVSTITRDVPICAVNTKHTD